MSSSGITLADVLAVLDADGPSGEPVTASEVAAELGCGRETAREALDELATRDGVESKEVADGVRVWWTSDRDLRRYEAIVETVNDGIYVKDEDNRFTLVNETFAEMVGYPSEDLVGRDSSFLVSEEVMEAAEEIYRDLRTGDDRTETVEATMETADGETFEAEASFAVIPREDEHERVGVVRDVTERKERERRLERHNERLESFASMLAHELRNPVTVGQIYSQRLSGDADAEAVEYVTDAFDRIDDVIDVLLVLARGQDAVGDAEPVPLDAAAREAWDAVDASAGTLTVATDRVVRANATYLRHFFENLFENAVEHGSTSRRSQADDAVEHGSTSPRSQAHEDAVEHGAENSGTDDEVTVTVGALPSGFYVADDGFGIPPEDRETVFEAGYTTAASSGGTGVGLTFVRELAEVYDWECSLTDSESGGARFEFTNVSFCADE